MRIFVDAIPLLVRSAGVKNYLFHWITHLRRLLGRDQIPLFPFLGGLGELDHEGSIADPPGTLARQGLLFALNYIPTHAWHNPLLDVVEPHADIFHATKLLHPPRRPRLSATLHDMTCWLMPEFHQAANVAAEKRFAEWIWKPAAGLIAVSENTRRDAERVLGLDPEKIAVIHPGVAEPYFAVGADPAAAARVKYALDRPYALYVGTIEPRKNIDRLLDAWQMLSPFVRDEFDLLLIGPEGWQSGATMARLRIPPPGVRYLGYVPEPDLPGLTAAATVFVYLSLYEGFGFPVAQAMAAGVPVLTSNISSLPEITNGAAALVDPRSIGEIHAALDRLLTSPALRAHMIHTGRNEAQHLRWDNAARQSVEFFERILGI